MHDHAVRSRNDGAEHGRALRGASGALAWGTAALGGLVLLGWALDVPLLKTAGHAFVSMKRTTALSLVLLGAALAAVPSARRRPSVRRGVLAASGAVALLAAASLLEWIAGVDLRIDELLGTDPGPHPPTSHPGRMAGGTAFDLLLLAAATAALCVSRVRAAQGLAAAALLVPSVGLVGYLYGAPSLYAVGSTLTLAIHTAVGLLALALAVLFRDPDSALMSPFTRATLGRAVARRLVPAAVAIPILLGWLRLYGQRKGLYDTNFGSVLLVETEIVLLAAMAWLVGASLARADAERRGREAELARSNAELEQFAYVASHDLQEPLRAVAGCTGLLARKYTGRLDPEADELIRHAGEGAARMQRLIEDLLLYSRVATRGRELEPASSEAALDDALRNLSTAIGESGARVERGPLPKVTADAGQLVQLFQNLVGNAIKFRADGRTPRVRVTAVADPPQVRFTVADNGIGIEPRHFERIFGVFQRLHSRSEYPGTGIGLALCKRIVERHGGRLWVESVPGEGSSFHFTLPEGGPA